jgi:hypothetical protein
MTTTSPAPGIALSLQFVGSSQNPLASLIHWTRRDPTATTALAVVTPAADAESVAPPFVPAVTVKVALVWPAGITTVAGTVATLVLELASVTWKSLASAAVIETVSVPL